VVAVVVVVVVVQHFSVTNNLSYLSCFSFAAVVGSFHGCKIGAAKLSWNRYYTLKIKAFIALVISKYTRTF